MGEFFSDAAVEVVGELFAQDVFLFVLCHQLAVIRCEAVDFAAEAFEERGFFAGGFLDGPMLEFGAGREETVAEEVWGGSSVGIWGGGEELGEEVGEVGVVEEGGQPVGGRPAELDAFVAAFIDEGDLGGEFEVEGEGWC